MSATYASIATVTDAPRPGPSLSTDEIARITGGRILAPGDRPIRGAAVDSRLVAPGNLFVALAGERTDGHRFLRAAAEAGAGALLVDHLPSDQALPPGIGVVAVPDPLAGLHAVAASWRTRFTPLTVGITGSIAKTSTKDAVAAVMAARYVTLRSEGNQNNEVGLPLDDPATRGAPRGGRPRDGDVRRRRDRAAGGDRAAADRRRDGGPRRAPLADRHARRDRACEGRADREPPARRPGRAQRRRRTGPPDGRADERPRA